MLGVLVNVGKHKPDLFKGPLQPLLSFYEIYDWDFERVRANPYTRIMMPWARMGEFAFEMAKTWNFAAYREQKLREMVLPLIRADRSTAEYVNKATASWSIPAAEKAALEGGPQVTSPFEATPSLNPPPQSGEGREGAHLRVTARGEWGEWKL